MAVFRHYCQTVSVVLMPHIRCMSFNRRQTYYDVLGIERTATSGEIKSAFKELSKQLHPDLNRSDPSFHSKFIKLNEAYGVLGKPVSRRNYDLSISAPPPPHRQTYARQTGEDDSYNQRQQFYDETIYEMRDRSKDKDYEGRPYYGIRGVKRMPNSYIVMGIIAFTVTVTIIRVIIMQRSTLWRKEKLDARDKLISEQYLATRARASSLSKEEQIEALRRRIEANAKK